ncbi:hypothetical protein GJU39_10650 [Pedobacter petrophilus]|uniref:Uncharacterized protein n=1 Tax=Pedobacter petrophilus TaxID=1908241 RepID=A0A7K0FYM4_9SPHI|nr:hypothetical protein [Pedobacter petrophilus]MRX76551.1 hypothetical protein [Pedobacter petrophilus]
MYPKRNQNLETLYKNSNFPFYRNFNDDFEIRNWIAVWFPIKPKANIKDFIKSEDTNEGGFIYSNRITRLPDLKEVEAQLTTADKIVFKNEEFEISLETKAYQNNTGTKGDLAIKKGFSGWGSDNRMPKNEFKSVRLKTTAGVYQLPKSALSRLYEINLELTKVYIGKNKEIYIATTNSDGSESYHAIWCLKNNKLFSMTVMQTIP